MSLIWTGPEREPDDLGDVLSLLMAVFFCALVVGVLALVLR